MNFCHTFEIYSLLQDFIFLKKFITQIDTATNRVYDDMKWTIEKLREWVTVPRD